MTTEVDTGAKATSPGCVGSPEPGRGRKEPHFTSDSGYAFPPSEPLREHAAVSGPRPSQESKTSRSFCHVALVIGEPGD
jgi:hypothetical protein